MFPGQEQREGNVSKQIKFVILYYDKLEMSEERHPGPNKIIYIRDYQ